MDDLTVPADELNKLNQFLELCNDIQDLARDQYKVLQHHQKSHTEATLEANEHTLIHLNKVTNCIEHEVVPRAKHLYTVANLFDFDHVKANGYRSFLMATERCCAALLDSMRNLGKNSLVRLTSSFTVGPLDARRTFVCYCQCLYEIADCLHFLVRLAHLILEYQMSLDSTGSPPTPTRSNFHKPEAKNATNIAGEIAANESYDRTGKRTKKSFPLFLPMEVQNKPQISAFVDAMDDINQEVFYGRCVGFQYCVSMRPTMTAMSTMMASYVLKHTPTPCSTTATGTEAESSRSPSTQTVCNAGTSSSVVSLQETPEVAHHQSPLEQLQRHLNALPEVPLNQLYTNFMDPDQRGRRVAYVSRHAPVQFCKQFWNLLNNKVALNAPLLVVPAAAVAYNFSIPVHNFTLRFKARSQQQEDGTFSVPTPGGAVTAVRLRIQCTKMRDELRWCTAKNARTKKFKSPHIIHGHVFPKGPAEEETLLSPDPVVGQVEDVDDESVVDVEESVSQTSSSDSVPVQPAVSPGLFGNIGQYLRTFWGRPAPTPCKNLLFQIHGGGFVGQSAQAHDVYLRFWAESLDCPIVSVDYSKAPEFPFPQAVDEAFYAYCWVLKHAKRYICSNLERIVLVGDSAGGNLVLGLTQRILQHNLPPPHGLLLCYTPVLVDFAASPARLLSVMDPLLPIGILSRCLLAYAGIEESRLMQEHELRAVQMETEASTALAEKQERDNCESSSTRVSMRTLAQFVKLPNGVPPSPLSILRKAHIPANPLMSPYLMSENLLKRFPSVVIMGCHMDPLLDDCVEFAKRLRRASVPVVLRVMEGVPHGFLNLILLSPDCRAASDECLLHLKNLFEAV